MMKKPNVLWIMTDQQRSEAMGCLDPSYKSPNLDELASRSIRFDKHITTAAQCTPARATWMTGRYPHQVGVNQIGHGLSTELPTVGKEFQKHGYETAYFGKWHLFTPVEEHGFEITEGPTNGYLDFGGGQAENVRAWSHQDAIATAQALHYLDHYSGDKPFFTILSWNMPHPGGGPFELIEQFAGEHPLEKMPVPRSFYEDDLSTKPEHQRMRATSEESEMDEEIIRQDAQKYRTMIQQMDWHLGRVLKMLKHRGLAENTVILYTSDHGDLQGAHRLRLKGVVPYKELYEVPLLLHIPGRTEQGGVVTRITSSAAVPGTLLDIAGAPVPDCFEGGSLLPMIESPDSMNATEDDYVFIEHYKAYWGFHPFRGIQTHRWKYVYYYNEDVEEMYDLVNDPDELRNAAYDQENAEIKRKFRQQVDTWWEQTGALRVQPVKFPGRGPWAEV
ncbi:sulfatase [Ammoniphilus sp. YIM 78166]|uniref:sulfatase family protein n=1 Tax=Ammoniphilus sp. YIM 78166 TaxID=1644106 RepID=UPI00106FD685|nr:sulfatase-like hydrolase/transferase [Ammoniphilus sp. YIM 78166]